MRGKRVKDITKSTKLFLAVIVALALIGFLAVPYSAIIGSANIAGFGSETQKVDVSTASTLPQSLELQKIDTLNKEVVQKNKQATTQTGTAKSMAVDELRQKLVERKQNLELLMEKNPEEALASILPQSIARQLPAEVKDLVEKPVSLIGGLEVLHKDDFENKKSVNEYTLNTQTERLDFYPAGEELQAASGTTIRVNGYRLGKRVMAANVQNTIQTIRRAEPETIGEQKTLVVLINYLDSGPEPFTPQQAKEFIFNGGMQSFFDEASYGKVFWTGEVIGWHTLQKNYDYTSWPVFSDVTNDPDSIFGFIKQKNIDMGKYDRIVLLVDGGCGGQGSVGKWPVLIDVGTKTRGPVTKDLSVSWVGHCEEGLPANQWDYVHLPNQFMVLDFVLSHELGHNLGVMHANSWDCGKKVLYDASCTHYEYGNWFDVMGYGQYALHFNARFKEIFRWMEEPVLIQKSGTYTITPIELSAKKSMAKIYSPYLKQAPYYLEYRQATGFDQSLNSTYTGINLLDNQKGLFINWVPYLSTSETQQVPAIFTRLLDITPTNSNLDDWLNVVLKKLGGGTVFRDAGRGIVIGPVISAQPDKITFKVEISKPTCVRNDILVTDTYFKYFNYKAPNERIELSGEPGSIIPLSIAFINADSVSCGPSEFQTNGKLPTDWDMDIQYPIDYGCTSSMSEEECTEIINNALPATSLTVNPDYGYGFMFGELKVPDTAAIGKYQLELKIKNLDSGKESKIKIDYTVTMTDEFFEER